MIAVASPARKDDRRHDRKKHHPESRRADRGVDHRQRHHVDRVHLLGERFVGRGESRFQRFLGKKISTARPDQVHAVVEHGLLGANPKRIRGPVDRVVPPVGGVVETLSRHLHAPQAREVHAPVMVRDIGPAKRGVLRLGSGVDAARDHRMAVDRSDRQHGALGRDRRSEVRDGPQGASQSRHRQRGEIVRGRRCVVRSGGRVRQQHQAYRHGRHDPGRCQRQDPSCPDHELLPESPLARRAQDPLAP